MINEALARRQAVSVGAAPQARVDWLLPLLVLLFFSSGISGLIYQVLWLRLLTLVFGVTVWAASTVLASFMAGLALGSFAAGRLVDRARHPLRWFGTAEILVGLAALATQPALEAVEQLYVALAPSLQGALGPLTVVRFLFACTVLLVPTTLMGASLPIVVKSSLSRDEHLGERMGVLYGTNTAGAVVGTLLAGFYLVGELGISRSFSLAAALNISIGAIAVVASFLLGDSSAQAAHNHPPRCAPAVGAGTRRSAVSQRARHLVLLVFAISGFVSLALEVVWFRVLVLYFDATTYAFTVMLAAVLSGIAVGSYLVTPLMRRRLDWLVLLAGLELALSITTLLSLVALIEGSDVFTWSARLLGGLLPSPIAVAPVTSFFALFPTTLLMGIAFPVGVRLWAGGGDANGAAGARIGLFYCVNVFGAILGSLTAGFVLLPWLGSRYSLVVLALLSLVAGLLLVTYLPRSSRARLLIVGAVVLFIGGSTTLPDPFLGALSHRYPGDELLWHEEGLQGTVSVHRENNGTRRLYLDGLTQASDGSDVRVHRMIGHLPLALHSEPEQVLVVGLGGGATAGAASQYAPAEIDVVELSGSVVRASEWFRHVNQDVLNQPNVHLQVDDGRNYLLLTTRRYDVVAADIIQPHHAGAGNVYSAEYFRLVRDALNADGLVVQWIGVSSRAQQTMILRTFLSVFPETTLWSRSLLVGSKRPLRLDQAAFERKWQDPATREVLESMGVSDFTSLLSLYQAGPDELARYVGQGPILTDDRPVTEFFLSLSPDAPARALAEIRGDPAQLVKR